MSPMSTDVEEARVALCRVLDLNPAHVTFAPVTIELGHGDWVRTIATRVSIDDNGMAEITFRAPSYGAA